MKTKTIQANNDDDILTNKYKSRNNGYPKHLFTQQNEKTKDNDEKSCEDILL